MIKFRKFGQTDLMHDNILFRMIALFILFIILMQLTQNSFRMFDSDNAMQNFAL